MINDLDSVNFKPLVSIVMPVYNGSNYLKCAIDSALKQTYNNIEIIVINDGSNDNGLTEDIAKSYGDKIKYLYKENGGVATALNVGIQNSTGEYISWLSHDDMYFENKIERQVAYLSSTSSPEVILYSDYKAIDADDNLIQVACIACDNSFDCKQEFLLNMFKARIHGCSLLIPKKCFSDVGYFDEKLKTTQDYDLWFKFFKSGYEFRHMPEVLICSRWHEEQGTRSLYKIAHKEIEELYISAIDTFYEDIARFSVITLMELIVDFRYRKLRKAPNHLLRLLKLCNREIYQQLFERHAGQLSKSRRDMIKVRAMEITTVIRRLLGL